MEKLIIDLNAKIKRALVLAENKKDDEMQCHLMLIYLATQRLMGQIFSREAADQIT